MRSNVQNSTYTTNNSQEHVSQTLTREDCQFQTDVAWLEPTTAHAETGAGIFSTDQVQQQNIKTDQYLHQLQFQILKNDT